MIFFFKVNKCGHRNVLSKRQVWMSILHIINLKKKKSWTQDPGFFLNKKLILDYYFCLKSGPVFLFQIFIIAPLFLPRDIKLYHLILSQVIYHVSLKGIRPDKYVHIRI